MSEPTRLSIQVTAGDSNRKSNISRLFTLETLIQWINLLELDDYTRNGLVEIASRYPATALPYFKKNINLMIQRVRAKRIKDQLGEESNAEEIRVSEESNTEINIKPTVLEENARKFSGPQRKSITEEDLTGEHVDQFVKPTDV
jgi:hypothetical protein